MDRLTSLIARITRELLDTLEQVEIGRLSIDDWHEQTATLLAIGHVAAYQSGAIRATLSDAARIRVQRRLDEQLQFLAGFADAIATDINNPDAPWASWRRRATMYADTLSATAEMGKYALWPIPAYPRDGQSECLSNCKCAIRLVVLSEEELNGDVYWNTSAVEHCPTCQQRGATWQPLRIRNGVVSS